MGDLAMTGNGSIFRHASGARWHTQLSHAVPEALPVGAEREGYLEAVIDNLLRRDEAN